MEGCGEGVGGEECSSSGSRWKLVGDTQDPGVKKSHTKPVIRTEERHSKRGKKSKTPVGQRQAEGRRHCSPSAPWNSDC